MAEAQRSASSVFIVGLEEKSYGKQGENFRSYFPKGELAAPGRQHAWFRRDGVERRGRAPACHSSRGDKQRVPLRAERLYAGCFVLLDIEDGVELRDLQQVVHFLGEVEQLEVAALVFARSESADQLADT
jgi:hypothetical protein